MYKTKKKKQLKIVLSDIILVILKASHDRLLNMFMNHCLYLIQFQ